MEERFETKQQELRFLAKEYNTSPEAFVQPGFIEDAEVLGEFGIYIPGKETCASGLLKLWPEDFIVEEITKGGEASVTISGKNDSTEGDTVYATLVKCGLSTIEAIEDIAGALDLRTEDIAYAGIKDKDAITAQMISLRRTHIDSVRRFTSPHFFLKDIRAGKGAMEKGGLVANRFTIMVRTQPEFFGEESSAIFSQKLAALQEYGFYNFFYLQRFGTPRLRNFVWARHILRGEHEAAVRDILSYEGSRELPYFKQLRRDIGKKFGHWNDIQKSIEPFPLVFKHEHTLVNYLASHPGDFVGALRQIPDQITLWMYALASLMFNQYISNCLMRGEEPPSELPFFLSRDRAAYEPYADMLRSLGLYPPQFEHLKPFPHVLLKTRFAPTKDRAVIKKAEVVDEGVVLQFELAKGQYATTFLSHLFNLVGGKIEDTFSRERVDCKALLGEEPLTKVLQNFQGVIRPKGENLFAQMGGE